MTLPVRTREILEQLHNVHKIYGRRLRVLQGVLCDSGDVKAYCLAEYIKAIGFHNEQCQRVLFSENYPNVADKVWDTKHAQDVYQPLILMLLSDPALLCDILARPDLHRITEEHNAEVFGDDCQNYFDIETFPVFMIEHFFHLQKTLKAYSRAVGRLTPDSITQLIVWLDEQMQTLT